MYYIALTEDFLSSTEKKHLSLPLYAHVYLKPIHACSVVSSETLHTRIILSILTGDDICVFGSNSYTQNDGHLVAISEIIETVLSLFIFLFLIPWRIRQHALFRDYSITHLSHI